MSLLDSGAAGNIDNRDCVDFNDIALLAEKWCVEAPLLAEDLDRNGKVDSKDFAVLAEDWRVGLRPDPMTWAAAPRATSSSTIAVTAATAMACDGGDVEYYFEDQNAPSRNSGWLSFAPGEQPVWEDSGLSSLYTYCYRVKARNKTALFETGWLMYHAQSLSARIGRWFSRLILKTVASICGRLRTRAPGGSRTGTGGKCCLYSRTAATRLPSTPLITSTLCVMWQLTIFLWSWRFFRPTAITPTGTCACFSGIRMHRISITRIWARRRMPMRTLFSSSMVRTGYRLRIIERTAYPGTTTGTRFGCCAMWIRAASRSISII